MTEGTRSGRPRSARRKPLDIVAREKLTPSANWGRPLANNAVENVGHTRCALRGDVIVAPRHEKVGRYAGDRV